MSCSSSGCNKAKDMCSVSLVQQSLLVIWLHQSQGHVLGVLSAAESEERRAARHQAATKPRTGARCPQCSRVCSSSGRIKAKDRCSVSSVQQSLCFSVRAAESVWKVFRIGTVRYNWPMSAHASPAFSIAHCTDSEDLPAVSSVQVEQHSTAVQRRRRNRRTSAAFFSINPRQFACSQFCVTLRMLRNGGCLG